MTNFKGLQKQLKDLIVLAQAGDKQAYNDFLELLYPFVRSVLYRKLGNIVDIDDVTQNCIMGIHKNLSTYNAANPIKPWILAIIRYKLADYFRKQGRLKEKIVDIDVTKHEAATNQDMNPAVKQLADLLAQMPDKLRSALVLTQLEGLTYEQAAAKEKISEPALRKRISRAYKELHKLVNKNFDLEIDYEKR